jgi:hypothetical protein
MKITHTFAKTLWLVLLCASLPVHAQLAGPIAGVVFDEGSLSLHQILGMPGGATLGPAIALPHGLRHAVVSPQRHFALGIADDDSRTVMLIAGLLGSEPSSLAVEGVEGGPTSIVFSADGGTAVLLYGEQRSLRLVRGLPSELRVSQALEIPGIASGNSMAVSNDGMRILLAEQPAGGTAALQLLQLDDAGAASWRTLAWLEQPGPATFLNGRDAAVVADGQRISLFDNLGSDLRISSLATEEDGIGRIAGLGQTRTNRGLIVTGADSGQVVLMNIDEPWQRESFAAPAGLTQCAALQPGGPFLVAKPGETPLYVLDVDPVPGVYFVPRGLELRQ